MEFEENFISGSFVTHIALHWNIVMRDAGWRVKSAHGRRLINTKMKRISIERVHK